MALEDQVPRQDSPIQQNWKPREDADLAAPKRPLSFHHMHEQREVEVRWSEVEEHEPRPVFVQGLELALFQRQRALQLRAISVVNQFIPAQLAEEKPLER